MAYHVFPARMNLVLIFASLCAGAVGGLALPRWLAARRLGRAAPDRDAQTAGRTTDEVDFAATIAGVALLSLGLAWVLIAIGGSSLEAYRGFLLERFTFSITLTRLLLVLPCTLAVCGLGALCSLTLAVLHGWQRLIGVGESSVTRLWAGLLAGCAIGASAGGLASVPMLASVGAPLALFVAAAVASVRGGRTTGTSDLGTTPHAPVRAEWLLLLTVGGAAWALAVVILVQDTRAGAGRGGLSALVAVAGWAALAGVWCGRTLLNRLASHDLAPLVSAACALVLVVSAQSAHGGPMWEIGRVAGVALLAAISAVSVGRCVGRAYGSIQTALVWIGVCALSGFGLACLVVGTATAWAAEGVAFVVSALAIAAVAGLVLIVDPRMLWATRAAGLAGIGAVLIGLPSVVSMPSEARTDPSRSRADEQLPELARAVLATDRACTVTLSPLGTPPHDQASSGWDVDMERTPAEFVVFRSRPQGAAADRPLHDAIRLVGRAHRRAAGRGRLAVELPNEASLLHAVARYRPAGASGAWRGYRLSVTRGADRYEAFVFGADIVEWVGRARLPADRRVRIDPLREADWDAALAGR